MTMIAKRLAELDAAIARFPVSLPWYSCATSRNGVTGIHGEPHGEPPHQGVAYLADVFGDAAPVVEAMNSLPDLRAHIDAQAATIARSRAEVERLNGRALVLEAHLTEAIERVEKGDLDDRMCCDGHMCGCQGSTNADQFLHFARAALTGAAS